MQYIEILPKKSDKKDYSLLVKHNNLVQGKYYLEASEQKLLYKIFEEVQKKGYTTRDVIIKFNEFYRDYKSILGKNITRKDFKDLIENLQDKKAYIIKGDEYIRTQWYKIYGKLDLSEVKLQLDEDVFDYVQSLNKNFTGLRLETLYAFKSFHSMRIYELLKQWSQTKTEILYPIDSLKELLGVEDNVGYKNFANFNKYVLQKAKKEINEKSELTIEVEGKKEGRAVKGVCFKILDIDKSNNTNLVNPSEPIEELIEEPIIGTNKFYIPKELNIDKKLETLFSRQFNKYDFTDTDYYSLLLESEEIALKKDGSTLITALNYKLFAKILKTKIDNFEYRRKIEEEKEEEERLYGLLNEEQRIEASVLNMTAKEYLEFTSEIESEITKDTDNIEFAPNF